MHALAIIAAVGAVLYLQQRGGAASLTIGARASAAGNTGIVPPALGGGTPNVLDHISGGALVSLPAYMGPGIGGRTLADFEAEQGQALSVNGVANVPIPGRDGGPTAADVAAGDAGSSGGYLGPVGKKRNDGILAAVAAGLNDQTGRGVAGFSVSRINRQLQSVRIRMAQGYTVAPTSMAGRLWAATGGVDLTGSHKELTAAARQTRAVARDQKQADRIAARGVTSTPPDKRGRPRT